jgi:hypothetical protein
MLSDAREIAIAANAKQKNIRDPRCNRQPFFHLLDEFFEGTPLTGRMSTSVLDSSISRRSFASAAAPASAWISIRLSWSLGATRVWRSSR